MKCSHDPKQTKGVIGMYHCPDCGQMIVAGMEHPDWDKLDLENTEVICDESNNTEETLKEGKIIVDLYIPKKEE